jgi:hypothetical protein
MATEANMASEGPPAVQVSQASPIFHRYKPENFLALIAEKNESQDAWLDAALKNEIKQSQPWGTDIDPAGKCNVERLAEECAKVFPPNRVFCCKFQLQAMVRLFALRWGFAVAINGKSFKCFYGPSDKKNESGENSKVDPSKRRKVKDSLKSMIQCPFTIKFTFQKRSSPEGTADSFLPVRVTSPVFQHTCQPNRPPFIPGLAPAAFTKRNNVDPPTLKKSTVVADGSVDFKWVALGSDGSYIITAKGKLAHSNDDRGIPSYTGLNVICNCPEGERQNEFTPNSGKLNVCKHGSAALELVVDKGEAANTLKREPKRRKTEMHVRNARRKEEEEEKQCQAQETEMPGERSRLEYGIDALGSEQVVALIKKSMGTLEGLRTVATLFPDSIMPAPNTKYCVRCKKTYDDRFLSQRLCQIPHPEGECNAERDKYRSWKHCGRCDKTFYVTGEYNFGKDRIIDEGEWCFEGEHVPDDALVAQT